MPPTWTGLRRPHRRLAPAGLACVLALAATAGLTAPAGAAGAVPERVTLPPGGAVTVAGHGYGHGIGMSQYGARGAAAAGVGYQSILSFYYPGTTASSPGSGTLRVQLTADTDNDLRVLATSGLTAAAGGGAARPLAFTGATATQWRVTRTAAGMVVAGLVGGAWRTWSTALAAPVTLGSPSGLIRVVLPNGQREYRGAVRAVANGAAPGLRSVNVVPMELYLRSVVPAEMPASWAAEALKAQAVAARSYASRNRHDAGTRAWDTCDSTACQVYAGYRHYSSAGQLTSTHEYPATTAAITATANQIRTYRSVPAFAQFSSSNGGWTAVGSQPYLVAKPDPWDAYSNPNATWSVRLPVARIGAAYPAIGTPRAITVTARGGGGQWAGRVSAVTIAGTTTSVTVTGAAFRTAFGLRSAWWKVTGSTRADPDFTADGRFDLLARTPSGVLKVYEGNGAGGYAGPARQIGTGWQVMRIVTRAGDLTSDGNPDVLAVDRAGTLWLYPAGGTGGFGARRAVGSGWGVMNRLAAAGDLSGDGAADVAAIDTSGRLWLYPGTGAGGFGARKQIGSGWGPMTALLGAGDLTGDGRPDLVARDNSGGLFLYRGAAGGALGARSRIGTGWNTLSRLAVLGDWSGTGRPSIIAVGPNGTLYEYPWSGTALGARRTLGTGWQVYDALL